MLLHCNVHRSAHLDLCRAVAVPTQTGGSVVAGNKFSSYQVSIRTQGWRWIGSDRIDGGQRDLNRLFGVLTLLIRVRWAGIVGDPREARAWMDMPLFRVSADTG